MSYYLDTSAAVAAHTPEPATERVQTWLEKRGARELAISPWVLTEFESALSLKVRSAKLSLDQRALVRAQWQQFRETSLAVLPVGADAFEAAAQFAARHDLALRAGDALHLAVAAAHGCTLVTLDERMAKAAPELGVPLAAI